MNNNTSSIAMFVFVRNDLNNINKAVQAGHACFEYIKKYSNMKSYAGEYWKNGRLIYSLWFMRLYSSSRYFL